MLLCHARLLVGAIGGDLRWEGGENAGVMVVSCRAVGGWEGRAALCGSSYAWLRGKGREARDGDAK